MRRSTVMYGLGMAVAAAAFPSTGKAQTGTPLRVATIPADTAAQAYYAQDRGLFRAAGLNATVTTIPIGAEVVAAVLGGSIDVGQANVMSLAIAYEHGLPLAFIAPAGVYRSDKPTAVLLVQKGAALSNAAALEGKVVAINGVKTVTQVAVEAWVDQNGGDSSRVRFLELPMAEMEAALVAGRADAALLGEPTASLALASGHTRALGKPFDAIAKTWLVGGWFARAAWIDANLSAARAFAGAMRETARWANGNPAQSAQILEAYTKISIGTATRVLYAEQLDPRLIQPQLDIAAKYALIPHDLPATSLIAAFAGAPTGAGARS
jgi:NitT/TauT family transport system substrate-binding protein